MEKITDQQFNTVKEKAEELYKSVGEVHCPYFGEKITFNAKGLEHLKFKEKNHARSSDDQYMRLKLLKLAPEVIKLSKTIQGISEQKVFELNRSNHRNERKLVDAVYYEFIAIIENSRVRVIVKQIGTAPKYFWSVIPFWKVNKDNGKRRFHYGSPEND